jgi:hypothetical protein
MTCPRWDSDCLPGLANTGDPRKHAESEAVRGQYYPIRGQDCGQCPHPDFRLRRTFNRKPQPAAKGMRFVFILTDLLAPQQSFALRESDNDLMYGPGFANPAIPQQRFADELAEGAVRYLLSPATAP